MFVRCQQRENNVTTVRTDFPLIALPIRRRRWGGQGNVLLDAAIRLGLPLRRERQQHLFMALDFLLKATIGVDSFNIYFCSFFVGSILVISLPTAADR